MSGDRNMEKNNNLWMPGDTGHVTKLKRSHPWFMDASEPELVCNKKKAIEDAHNRAVSGTPNLNISPWENTPNFQSGSGLFTDCLYGTELAGTYNLAARNMSPVGASDFNNERSSLEKQVRSNSLILLSVSHDVDDATSFLNYGATKYLVNQVADYNRVPENVFARGITCNKANDSFISSSPIFDTGSGNIIPVGPTYGKVNANAISLETTYKNVNSSISSMDHKYNKGEGSSIYFKGFQYDPEANNPSGRIISSYDLLMRQPSVQPFEVPPQAPGLKVLPNSEPCVNVSAKTTSQNDATAKNKVQKKTTAQKMPSNVFQDNFPSNAKSLLATGIFDGVPVKYVSWSRDKSLKGIIQRSSYLCGCKDCKGRKALKACEFELHAGGKTKQPNNHIYFENGKTVTAVVRELRSTPEEKLFDAIQSVSGSPINQTKFCIWKVAYEAAAVQLYGIYQKDEVSKSS